MVNKLTVDITICDDHQIVREGLREILEEEKDFNILDAVANVDELMTSVRNHLPRVILLDVSMPGRSGIDVIKDILMVDKSINILMLSMYAPRLYAIRALQAGAKGYLNKDMDPEELINAIKTVARGSEYITKEVSDLLYRMVAQKQSVEAHEKLSDREYEVMMLLGQGKTVTEVAHFLNLSVKTISTYRSRIFIKLNISSISELIQYLISKGLILSA